MSDEDSHRLNHYVPIWYQDRFLLPDMRQRKFQYLDLQPSSFVDKAGRKHTPTKPHRWGPVSCFRQRDLYTTFLGPWVSTAIERQYFQRVDDQGKKALIYWTDYDHTEIDYDALYDLMLYMTLQKLRTPKGLIDLAEATKAKSREQTLIYMQKLERIFGSIWAEAQWAIADASDSPTKFIVSDHPVTVYNIGSFPGSSTCREHRDPDPRFGGTHVLFPLSLDKVLILSHVAWARNPYGDPLKLRPNPRLDRDTMFNYTRIQTGRRLSELEVRQMNYVIKKRAWRYIAAAREEWLYPERDLTSTHWSKLGGGLLFMPEPRQMGFSTQVVVGGYEDGRPSDVFDEYGRRPGNKYYDDKRLRDKEWETFHSFQGEFARLMGPQHRGWARNFGHERTADGEEYHQQLLDRENRRLSRTRRGQ